MFEVLLLCAAMSANMSSSLMLSSILLYRISHIMHSRGYAGMAGCSIRYGQVPVISPLFWAVTSLTHAWAATKLFSCSAVCMVWDLC
jgi:hypothetical protein